MKIALCIVFICLSACDNTRSSSVRSQEMEAIAWLVEDCCHDIKRDPRELVTEKGSIGQIKIASWLANGDLSVQQDSYPLHVRKRQEQWIIIKQGLHSGAIVSKNNALLRLNDEISAEERAIFEETVLQENQLRGSTDRLVLQQAGLKARSRQSFSMLQALANARLALDRQVLKND